MKIKPIVDIRLNKFNDYECDIFNCRFLQNFHKQYCILFDTEINNNERCEECLNSEQF